MAFVEESKLVLDKSLSPVDNLEMNINYLVSIIKSDKDLDRRIEEIKWGEVGVELDEDNLEFSKKYNIVISEFYSIYFKYLIDSINELHEQNIGFMFSVYSELMNEIEEQD